MTDSLVTPSTGDPVPEPIVEREEMPDGRYILYFSWPDGSPVPAADEAPTPDE